MVGPSGKEDGRIVVQTYQGYRTSSESASQQVTPAFFDGKPHAATCAEFGDGCGCGAMTWRKEDDGCAIRSHGVGFWVFGQSHDGARGWDLTNS